ncbi:MAG TPA: biotin--[acetyl-CoA-carboxylase] ligase [Coprothermobacter proteolyticus]|nr:biotin--[acetyl-CoA-carboxylase] ligase [Coprothermobacter proteolyticus]
MRIQKFEVVESTNDLARKYILEGNKEPAAFVAEHQTRGKGRLGRVWEDEPGKSLLVSFALPGSTYSNPPLLGLATAVFVGEYLDLLPVPWETKWPNDVLIEGKKVAGILPEGIWQDGLVGVVVGVGLNVNQDEFPDDTEATSIKHAFGQALPVEQPLMYLIYRMEQVYEQIVDFSEILATFKDKFKSMGKRLRVRSNDQVWEGTAVDIEEDGSLILNMEGKLVTLGWGEVTLR